MILLSEAEWRRTKLSLSHFYPVVTGTLKCLLVVILRPVTQGKVNYQNDGSQCSFLYVLTNAPFVCIFCIFQTTTFVLFDHLLSLNFIKNLSVLRKLKLL